MVKSRRRTLQEELDNENELLSKFIGWGIAIFLTISIIVLSTIAYFIIHS